MPHLVVAPDKFRGTASAPQICAAASQVATGAGWTADTVPMSDGGEGLLEAVGGQPQTSTVAGPLGPPVEAAWRLLPGPEGTGPTAIIEMSKAAGRALLAHPKGDDPVRANTAGVGHLLLAARDAGATTIIIGCGGSATTDGGWGAVEAVGSAGGLAGIELVVACDVTTAFRDAARVFGPQKGATPEQVHELTARLEQLVDRYRRQFGVDVDAIAGAGAAGGLGGGLAALGARLAPGFDLIADLNGLGQRIAAADLVITGEGHLDPPSFHGKVPGGVLALARRSARPVVCIVGGVDRAVLADPPAGLEIVSLVARYGERRARAETLDLIGQVTEESLARFCP